jgi:hypothetical protein
VKVLANTGLVLWIIGALVYFGLDGTPADVVGGTLLALGVVLEVVATLAILSRRGRGPH